MIKPKKTFINTIITKLFTHLFNKFHFDVFGKHLRASLMQNIWLAFIIEILEF